MTALTHTATARLPKAGWTRPAAQVALLFALLVVTTVIGLTVSLLFPRTADGGVISLAAIEADRASTWAIFLAAGTNIVLAVATTAIASLLLVPARGWRWATAGFAVALAGGAAYAVGVGGWAMVSWFAGDPALTADARVALVQAVNGDALHGFAPALVGALLLAIGGILMAIGLWRSGNVPRWVAVLLVAGGFMTFLPRPGGLANVIFELPQAVSGVMVGWYLWRRSRVASAAAPAVAQG